MLKIVLRLWVMGFMALTTATAYPVAAQVSVIEALRPPNAEEEKAFFALSDVGFALLSPLQREMIDLIGSESADRNVQLCEISKKIVELKVHELNESRETLRVMMSKGVVIDGLLRTHLMRADSRDTFYNNELEYCLRATAEGDDLLEAKLFIEQQLLAFEGAKAGLAQAEAKSDRLLSLEHIQTMYYLIGEVIDYMDILKAYEIHQEPMFAALFAKLPALRTEYASVKTLYQTRVAVITDPERKKEAPYVYKPLVLPPLPADDEAFNSVVSGLIAQAMQPSMNTLMTAMKTNTPPNCTYIHYTRRDIAILHNYTKFYITKQKQKGFSSAAGEAVLSQLSKFVVDTEKAAKDMCPKTYLVEDGPVEVYARQQKEVDALTVERTTLVGSLNAVMAANDALQTCAASQKLKALNIRLIAAIEGTVMTVMPQAEDPAMVTYVEARITDLFSLEAEQGVVETLIKENCPV